MDKTYHFISGLPRSGSTLLSSILKQNPKFTAGISDPLGIYAGSIIRDTTTAVGMESAVSIEKRREIIKGIFNSFYSDANPVCFNTNRGWTESTALLKDLFPNFKMIVCLRDIPWILDSFEQLTVKNPYTIKPLYHHQQLNSVYERTNMLMGNNPNFTGYVGYPIGSVRQSMFCNEVNNICYIEYDTLVNNPELSMRQIYEFIEEPWFDHDFDNVEDSYEEFDELAKIEGLHSVRKKVEYIPRKSILPDDLQRQYLNSTFWKYDFNQVKQGLNWIDPPQLNNRRIQPNIIKRQL
jgi:sulfotransferase